MQDYCKNLHGSLSMVCIHKSFYNHPKFIRKIVELQLKHGVSLHIALRESAQDYRKNLHGSLSIVGFTKLVTIIRHSLLRFLRFHLSKVLS